MSDPPDRLRSHDSTSQTLSGLSIISLYFSVPAYHQHGQQRCRRETTWRLAVWEVQLSQLAPSQGLPDLFSLYVLALFRCHHLTGELTFMIQTRKATATPSRRLFKRSASLSSLMCLRLNSMPSTWMAYLLTRTNLKPLRPVRPLNKLVLPTDGVGARVTAVLCRRHLYSHPFP